MQCKYCGNQLHSNAKFCEKCGTIVSVGQMNAAHHQSAPQRVAPQPTPRPVTPVQPPVQHHHHSHLSSHDSSTALSLQGSILTMGILAIIFGCTFFASFLGIVFGAIALGKANTYETLCGETKGRATVGRHLGRAGLIVGIVFTVLFIIYIIYLIIAINTYSYYSNRLYWDLFRILN